jgi:hypothetical protein
MSARDHAWRWIALFDGELDTLTHQLAATRRSLRDQARLDRGRESFERQLERGATYLGESLDHRAPGAFSIQAMTSARRLGNRLSIDGAHTTGERQITDRGLLPAREQRIEPRAVEDGDRLARRLIAQDHQPSCASGFFATLRDGGSSAPAVG